MTWSMVAHDPQTGAFAVAVTTAAFAVGASCPFLRSGVGAVSTQSLTNRYLGPAILDRLGRGLAPAAAIEYALATDAGRHVRQVHAVDRHGARCGLDRAPMRCLVRRAHGCAHVGRRQYARRAGGGRCDVRCHG
jgi:uncharacterized Ntn-hydrolase superfamily protein